MVSLLDFILQSFVETEFSSSALEVKAVTRQRGCLIKHNVPLTLARLKQC